MSPIDAVSLWLPLQKGEGRGEGSPILGFVPVATSAALTLNLSLWEREQEHTLSQSKREKEHMFHRITGDLNEPFS